MAPRSARHWSEFKQDDNGNGTWNLEQDRDHNAVNEIDDITNTVGTAWIDPAHDAAGNMTTMPQPLDPTSSYTTTYDPWNRLIKIANTSGTVLTNEYDGNHHRIIKEVDGGDTFDYYYNDQWQLLTDVKNGSTYALYVWHPYYIDALAVRMRASDMHYFLHDANFNVTAAYNITSGSGTDRQVVERYAYTPYGEVTFLEDDFDVRMTQESDIDNVHLYTGRERDSETGLQLNRYRWYHATLGRWVSWDPIEYGDGMNLYGYVGSNPGFQSDPLGLKCSPGDTFGSADKTEFVPGENNKPGDVEIKLNAVIILLAAEFVISVGSASRDDPCVSPIVQTFINPSPNNFDIIKELAELKFDPKILGRLNGGCYGVWINVQCYRCENQSWFWQDPVYGWEPIGKPEPHRCDIKRTDWFKRLGRDAVKVGPCQNGVQFEQLSANDIEKIRKDCQKQADDACKKHKR